MDWHYVADALLVGFVSIIGFVMSRLFKQVDELEKNARSFEVKAAGQYVSREDIHRLETAIFGKLDVISKDLQTLAIKYAETERRTGI
jgi:hypothetical protein